MHHACVKVFMLHFTLIIYSKFLVKKENMYHIPDPVTLIFQQLNNLLFIY